MVQQTCVTLFHINNKEAIKIAAYQCHRPLQRMLLDKWKVLEHQSGTKCGLLKFQYYFFFRSTFLPSKRYFFIFPVCCNSQKALQNIQIIGICFLVHILFYYVLIFQQIILQNKLSLGSDQPKFDLGWGICFGLSKYIVKIYIMS